MTPFESIALAIGVPVAGWALGCFVYDLFLGDEECDH